MLQDLVPASANEIKITLVHIGLFSSCKSPSTAEAARAGASLNHLLPSAEVIPTTRFDWKAHFLPEKS